MSHERVVDNLNRAHYEALRGDPTVCLLGEDVTDPYGGAFKVSRGLSTAFPGRVLATPISECAFVGMACGMALNGEKPIVEIMFGDFIGYAFDPLWNMAAKSVRMYGRRVPIHLLVRCPVGGNRGYGATHSQSPQKHLLGIPDLELFEVTPFHDNVPLFADLLDRGNPVILFENKSLYGRQCIVGERLGDLFEWRFVGARRQFVAVSIAGAQEPEVLIIAPGSVCLQALDAVETAFLDYELEAGVLVPSQLYPFDPTPVLDRLSRATRIVVVDEGIAGGSWAEYVASLVYTQLWGKLRYPVACLHSRDSIIPCARHLEEHVVVQSKDILRVLVR
jgi:2-oxoisovalerate dehydrogenase E1 component